MIHKIFFYLDAVLAGVCIVLLLVSIGDRCGQGFFVYYGMFFIGQSIQHHLFGIIPKIDIVKYDKSLKRYIGFAIGIEVSYFFLAFMFWTRAAIHPLYCYLCLDLGLPIYIGIAIVLHFIVSMLVFVQFLHRYITRKYYLIALGGFEVELRITQQR